MQFKFATPESREDFIRRLGDESFLIEFENCFPKSLKFSLRKQKTLKRFMVLEPEGLKILKDNLVRYPAPLAVYSFELLPPSEILGMTLFSSKNYILKEDVNRGFLLVEQNTIAIPQSDLLV